MVVLEAAAGAGVKVLFDGLAKGLGRIYEKAKRAHLESLLTQWRDNRLAETVHRRVDQARFVKTLWRVDEKLDLLDFYAQPRVECNDEKRPQNKRLLVDSFESFACKGSLLIEGTVGQGKSMLLRYMTVRELIGTQWLPLLVELRKMRFLKKVVRPTGCWMRREENQCHTRTLRTSLRRRRPRR